MLAPTALQGLVPKWFKGALCKSVIRQFESDRDLNITPSYNGSTSGFGPLNGGSNPSGVTNDGKIMHKLQKKDLMNEKTIKNASMV